MRNYYLMDIAKFVFSLFVITIHCYIVQTIANPVLQGTLSLIQGLAVPSFFCFTGFLLFKKLYAMGDYTQGTVWHLAQK